MSNRTHTVRMRLARISRVIVAGAIVASAALVVAIPSAAGADGEDIAGGLADLGVADRGQGASSMVTEAAEGGSVATALADPAAVPAPQEQPITGTTAQIEAERARTVALRDRLQRQLLAQDADRRAAEQRRDAALQAIATRLVALYEAQDDARVQSILAARDEEDDAVRAEILASLVPADRALFTAFERASADVDAAAQLADAARTRVLGLGTRIAAIDAVLDARRGPTKAEQDRADGKRFTIDANHVFATGPIPSIGYWGAMDGGGMLTGWMGFASAAVGGVGCEPPQPDLQPTGQIESGEASWYGPGFQGNNTASGEPFDTNQLTAAHKTLPLGTIVRVYSSATARCAFVRINDRGPYVDGRIIDLSRAAADAIGMESVAPVQIEVYA